MKNAILVHGCCDKEEYFDDRYPSLSNSHWFPWLQKQLLVKGISTQTPEMPKAYKPSYETWKAEVERYEINSDTILVGHSCGGGFLLRYLGENKIFVKNLFLVAPWLDPIKKREGLLDFQIDPKLAKRLENVHIFISDNETTEGVRESVEIISKAIPKSIIHRFKDKGHFTYDEMKTEKFPELLEVILA